MAHVETFDLRATHRLIPVHVSEESVLARLPLPAEVLADLSELDAGTNERLLAERNQITGIGPAELLYGVPEAAIVNASFTHAGPAGGRFNDARRGAWYAGRSLQTSIREVRFHKELFLRNGRIAGEFSFEYRDFLADFAGEFHVLDLAEREVCLRPGPIPEVYRESQALAVRLLFAGANGIVYPSVRHRSGSCVACFRPALVFHPRPGKIVRIKVST